MTPTPDKLAIPEAAVELAECPIGLFRSQDGELCLKTEYGNNEGRIDAYIVSSGEFFWGSAPQTIASQRAQMVVPVPLPHMPDRGYAEGIEAAAKSIDKRLRNYVEEHGSYDPDTGATEFPGNGDEYCAELEEIAEAIRALAPPAPTDNGEPATHDEESILDVISGNLRMESWVAGKTLTVMFNTESGERRFAKLRLTKIAAQPSPADLRGEPE